MAARDHRTDGSCIPARRGRYGGSRGHGGHGGLGRLRLCGAADVGPGHHPAVLHDLRGRRDRAHAGRVGAHLPGGQRQARLPRRGRHVLRQGPADDPAVRARLLGGGPAGHRRPGRVGRLGRQARHRLRQHVRLRPRLPAAVEGRRGRGPGPAVAPDQLHLGGRHRQPGRLLLRHQPVLRPGPAAGRTALLLGPGHAQVPRLRGLRRGLRLREVRRVRRRQDLRGPRPEHRAVAGGPQERPARGDPAARGDAHRQVRLPAGGRGRLPLRPLRRRHHRPGRMGARPEDAALDARDPRVRGPDRHRRRRARPGLPRGLRRAEAVRPQARRPDADRFRRRQRAGRQGRPRRGQGPGPGHRPGDRPRDDRRRHLGRRPLALRHGHRDRHLRPPRRTPRHPDGPPLPGHGTRRAGLRRRLLPGGPGRLRPGDHDLDLPPLPAPDRGHERPRGEDVLRGLSQRAAVGVRPRAALGRRQPPPAVRPQAGGPGAALDGRERRPLPGGRHLAEEQQDRRRGHPLRPVHRAAQDVHVRPGHRGQPDLRAGLPRRCALRRLARLLQLRRVQAPGPGLRPRRRVGRRAVALHTAPAGAGRRGPDLRRPGAALRPDLRDGLRTRPGHRRPGPLGAGVRLRLERRGELPAAGGEHGLGRRRRQHLHHERRDEAHLARHPGGRRPELPHQLRLGGAGAEQVLRAGREPARSALVLTTARTGRPPLAPITSMPGGRLSGRAAWRDPYWP
ncbi:putative 1-deoxy-D-xylulose 5-phosphate synthase [Actinacidiphila bryophytorum]|uniref:1-deoxy-D-xylulose 5-phosphate synthase n=1 Tax=Actinacidiphila bryophytorum TaxID=1436133 RepID=A0A9W4GZZ0_9ACTN|nr:putative 1-deoxy-D-xylulose 5-phosphate synthase [Actinacidiphila bryophytorum]